MKQHDKQEIQDILKKSSLVEGMSDDMLAGLLASSKAHMAAYEKGEIIFHDGDMPGRVYILIDGKVRILKDTLSGRQMFLTEITQPGEMFGEVYLFMRHVYDMYTEAACRTVVLEISNALFSVREGDMTPLLSVLQRNLMRIFASKAYFMNVKLKVLASGSMRGKIARYLLQLPAEHGVITLADSRDAMAAYLAVTRPSLSRELSAMQSDGILAVDGRKIRILDMERFEGYL